VRGNRTGKGWFQKGHSGNPSGRAKNHPELAPNTDAPVPNNGADRRTVGNLVTEARKFSGLAIDTLVELTKDNFELRALRKVSTPGIGQCPMGSLPQIDADHSETTEGAGGCRVVLEVAS
jgi:hypothetical protein